MPRTPHAPPAKRPTPIVALGASAGGLESLGRLLDGLPANFAAPVLVALHLDPHHASQAVQILQQRSLLAVETARSGAIALPGHVYVAPPDRHLEVRAGRLLLSRAPRVSYSRPSVDVLFTSVAAQYGPGAIVAVLSGTGSDGAYGVAAVKAAGGLAVAEAGSTAGFAGMPEAASRTGLVDAVLPVDQIPAFLLRAATRQVPVTRRQWLRMLDLLHRTTGARFARYRSSTLHRRLQQRLTARGAKSMAAYLALLDGEPAEVERLQAAFLIKVSAFTRDPSSWRALARQVRPMAATRTQVRAWSAGCATGEEAYTLGILLARELGEDVPWKVFATDLDEGALKLARAGRYTAAQVEGIPKSELERHFTRDGEGWKVGKDLRGHVVFGRHDLLRDPPLASIDLLACRNVLIYFQAEEKQRLLRRLANAVTPGGLLFLGRSEGMRPVPGFERVGDTTFFRRMAVPAAVPTPKQPSSRPSRKGAGAKPSRPNVSLRRKLTPGAAGGSDEAKFHALQDLNEELQSRNEELETVNEELQSLNDELSTMEEQMRGLGEESKRANDFLRLLLDTSSDVLVACDADNRVTFWNKAAIKRFRLSPAQAVGGELFDLVPALDTPALRNASAKVRRAGRGGRVSVKADGAEHIFDPLPDGGKRRSYLLRVRPG